MLGVAALLILAVTAADADPVPNGTPWQIAVEVDSATPDAALLATEVVARLRARLPSAGISVEVADAASRRADAWRLIVGPGPDGDVHAELRGDDDTQIRSRQIPHGRRRLADMAHTLALFALEALAPHLERLLSRIPSSQLPSEAAPPVIEPSAPAALPEPAPSFGLDVGVVGAGSEPGFDVRGGLQLGLGWSRSSLFAHLQMAWWLPLVARGDDYRLSVRYGTARAVVGAQWLSRDWRLTGGLGPVLSVARARREGKRITAGSHVYTSVGIGVLASVLYRVRARWGVGLGLALNRFSPYRQFTVDGVPVLQMGRSSSEVALFAAWEY
ncbi:MAG: hypothetical protein AAB426_04520 [Myxococcota bacterium]